MKHLYLLALLAPVVIGALLDVEGMAVEKFVPSRNMAYLRVASYNARYLELDGLEAVPQDYLYKDLVVMSSNVIILHEVPKAAFAPRRLMLDALLDAVGYTYRCEAQPEDSNYGIMVASLVPLGSCNSVDLGLGRSLVNVDIAYRGKNLDIVGSHISQEAEGARRAHVEALSDYIRQAGVIQHHLLLAIETDSASTGLMWNLRAVLPVEEVYRVIGWTRPNYARLMPAIVSHIFVSKSLETSAAGAYSAESFCSPHIAVIVDLY